MPPERLAKLKRRLKERQTPELQAKYDLVRQSFIGKERKGTQEVQEIIGDNDQDDFFPQFEAKLWDNECKFSVRYLSDEEGDEEVSTDREKVKWRKGREEVRFYDKPQNERHESGEFEFDIVLDEYTGKHEWLFSIRTRGLRFSRESIDNIPEDRRKGLDMPAWIDGGYVVYHDTKKNHVIGRKNYATGKVCNIPLPLAIDANGQQIYGTVDIDEQKGEMRVGISEEWLKQAAYPVTVDPTFGYTSIGASAYEIAVYGDYSYCFAGVDAPANDGTLDKITGYFSGTTSGTCTVSVGLYEKDGAGANSHDLISSVNQSISGTAAWRDFTFSSESVLAAETYLLAAVGDHTTLASGNWYFNIRLDTSGGTNSYTEGYNGPPLADPWNTSYFGSYQVSIYATYTLTASSSPPTVTTQAVSSIGETTATGNGNVTDDGGETITERGVCWNTGGTPTTADSKSTSAGTTGAFTASMTGLSGGVTYYVRAYAINSEGTSYGSEVSFTTLAPLEQEGFAFGDDDGSESAHTLDTQDTNVTAPLGTKTIRMLIEASGNPASKAFKLKYQKNGSGGYVDVPVGAGAGGSPTNGRAAFVAAYDPSIYWELNSTNLGTNYGDDTTGNDDNTAVASGDISTQDSYEGMNSQNDDGANSWFDTEIVTDAAMLVYIPAGLTHGNVYGLFHNGGGTHAQSMGLRATATGVEVGITHNANGSDQDALVYEIPDASLPGWFAISGQFSGEGGAQGDMGLWVDGVKVRNGTRGTQLAYGSGDPDFGNSNADAILAANVLDPASYSGGNWSGFGAITSSGILIANFTIDNPNHTNTSPNGNGDTWHEDYYTDHITIDTNELYISTSSNVAAGGEATTARLTAPSGKTTGDFDTGRRWDDENGSDSIDITSDDYTELEWVLTTQSPATTSDYFDFRVYDGDTVLDTYTVTPRWTIGTADTISEAGKVAWANISQAGTVTKANIAAIGGVNT